MNQPLNQDALKLNKETKLGNSRYRATELVADVVTQVITLDPVQHLINSIIRPSLGKRRMFALGNDGFLIIGVEVDFSRLSESPDLRAVDRPMNRRFD